MIKKIVKYGIFDSFILFVYFFMTKFIFRKARLIRFPIDVRGKKYMKVEKGFTTGRGCRLEAYPVGFSAKTLQIGENVQINDYVHIAAAFSVVIEKNVLIASKVYISDINHGNYIGIKQSNPMTIVKERDLSCKEINIKMNVWLGENVAVLPGVTIGENSIVGANSVVTKNIPPNSIAVGNPAKVIKVYDFESKKWKKLNAI